MKCELTSFFDQPRSQVFLKECRPIGQTQITTTLTTVTSGQTLHLFLGESKNLKEKDIEKLKTPNKTFSLYFFTVIIFFVTPSFASFPKKN